MIIYVQSYIAELDDRLNKQITNNQTTRNELSETNKINKHLQSFAKSIELSMKRLYNMINNELNLNRNWKWEQIFEENHIGEFVDNVRLLYLFLVMHKLSSQTIISYGIIK